MPFAESSEASLVSASNVCRPKQLARAFAMLRHTACRRRPCELLVVCAARAAGLEASCGGEGVRHITEQCGAHAGEEEASMARLAACEVQLQDLLQGVGPKAAQRSRNAAD